jgi:hypothetical protein
LLFYHFQKPGIGLSQERNRAKAENNELISAVEPSWRAGIIAIAINNTAIDDIVINNILVCIGASRSPANLKRKWCRIHLYTGLGQQYRGDMSYEYGFDVHSIHRQNYLDAQLCD